MSTFNDYTANLEYKLEQLHKQIRKIRDNFGDDKCWMDWESLFKLLPEGYTPPAQDIPIQLENCKQYLACRSHGTEYLPPPRWIKGIPDKPGVWILTTEGNYRFTISYRGGSLNIKDAPVYCSFGPIPREPECLLKKDSN